MGSLFFRPIRTPPPLQRQDWYWFTVAVYLWFGGFGQLFDLLLLPNMVDEHNASLRGKLGVSREGIPLYPVSGAIAATYPKPTPDQLGVKLLKAAYTKNGRLSVTQGVMATGATFAEVEEAFTALLKTGYVSIENDSVTGVVIYHFHEL
jgi:hypothetical protein